MFTSISKRFLHATRSVRQSIVSSTRSTHQQDTRNERTRFRRQLRCETLETRTLLAAGVLDTSLNETGWVLNSQITTAYDQSFAVASVTGNKTIVAGRSWDTTQTGQPRHAALAKYNEDGSFDTEFGIAGKVTYSFGSVLESNNLFVPINTIWDVAVDSSQRLVVVGESAFNTVDGNGSLINGMRGFVARLNANGTLDTTFGSGGVHFLNNFYGTTIGRNGAALGVAIDSLNRINLISRDANGGFFASVTQLSSSGNLNWSQTITSQLYYPDALSIAVAANNKIVVAAHVSFPNRVDPIIARYNPNGTLDPTFGGSGVIFGDSGEIYRAIAVDSSGRVVVTGDHPIPNSSSKNVRITRFNSIGSIDPSFNGSGSVSMKFGTHDRNSGRSIHIGGDNKITVGGIAGESHSGMLRVHQNGSPDLSFGKQGSIAYHPNPLHQGLDMSIDSSGRIVLSGRGSGDGFAFSRYTPTNIAPTLNQIPTAGAYVENAVPTFLAPSGAASDPDNTNYDNGKLTVRIVSGGTVGDRLQVRHDAADWGKISVSGNEIRYDFNLIGTRSGGVGTAPMVVSLNEYATPAAVQALIRRLSFNVVGDDPVGGNRVLGITLSDGNLGTSEEAFMTMTVTPVNDKPVVGSFGDAFTYTENDNPKLITTTATMNDVDSHDLDGGTLTVKLSAGGRPEDRLDVLNLGPISKSGNDIFHAATLIGTKSGGEGTTPLVVLLNANATPSRIQDLVRSVAYSNVSEKPFVHPRTVWVQVNDGDGGLSVPVTKTISIVSVNDAPELTGISGSMTYKQNANSVFVAASANLSDVDNAHFGNGKLTVEVTSGVDASNRLEIGGTVFSINGSNQIIREGLVIGTITSNGIGTNKLEVTFNSNAKVGIVQQLIRAIKFRTVSGTNQATRSIAFSVSDGLGGTSQTLTKDIVIT